MAVGFESTLKTNRLQGLGLGLGILTRFAIVPVHHIWVFCTMSRPKTEFDGPESRRRQYERELDENKCARMQETGRGLPWVPPDLKTLTIRAVCSYHECNFVAEMRVRPEDFEDYQMFDQSGTSTSTTPLSGPLT